jgi:cyclase
VSHEIMSAADGAQHLSSEMREHFGMEFDPGLLPDCEFLTNDTLQLTTHTGTHVDAPAHYGSAAAYGEPATIDLVPLDWFFQPGVVLDFRGRPPGTISAADLAKAFAAVGYTPAPLDIVLLNTGASEWAGTQRYFTDFVGLDGSGVDFLLDAGIQVIGTDAFSLDAPFTYIIDTFQRTGDRSVLWPAHMAGRKREFCQIERLANLAALPERGGFRVACFPVKIARAGAGWARAVAILDE